MVLVHFGLSPQRVHPFNGCHPSEPRGCAETADGDKVATLKYPSSDPGLWLRAQGSQARAGPLSQGDSLPRLWSSPGLTSSPQVSELHHPPTADLITPLGDHGHLRFQTRSQKGTLHSHVPSAPTIPPCIFPMAGSGTESTQLFRPGARESSSFIPSRHITSSPQAPSAPLLRPSPSHLLSPSLLLQATACPPRCCSRGIP